VIDVTLHYRLMISGSLPQISVELLRSRFEPDNITVGPACTAVTGTVLDQPELRALLALLWDTGGRLLSLNTEPETTSPFVEGET